MWGNEQRNGVDAVSKRGGVGMKRPMVSFCKDELSKGLNHIL